MLTIKKDEESNSIEEVRGVGTADSMPTNVHKENRLEDSLPMSFLGMRQEIPPLPDTPNPVDSPKLQESKPMGDTLSDLQNFTRQNSDSPIPDALCTPKPQENRSISDFEDLSHQDRDVPNSITLESPKPQEHKSVGDMTFDLQKSQHQDASEFPKLPGDKPTEKAISKPQNSLHHDRSSPTSDSMITQKQQGNESLGNEVSHIQNLSHQESDTPILDALKHPSLQGHEPIVETTSDNWSVPPHNDDTPTPGALDDDLITLVDSRLSSPSSRLENQERRLSDLPSQDEIPSSSLNSSPTAVPFHFRRPPSSPGSIRSHSSFPLSSADATSSLVPSRQRPRPRSTEFKSSNEFRPLWLVERHSTRQEPSPEEIYPSLPSSHSTSRTSSIKDIEEHDIERGTANLDSFNRVDTNYKFDGEGRGLLIETNQNDAQPDLLDSQQQTPTAPSSQPVTEEVALKAEASQELDLVPTRARNVRDLSVTNPSLSQESQMGKGLTSEEEKTVLETKANRKSDLVPTESTTHDQSFANIPTSQEFQMKEDSTLEEVTNHGPSTESFSPSTVISPLQQSQIRYDLARDGKMHKDSEHNESPSSFKSPSPSPNIPSSQQPLITEGAALENKIQQETTSFEPIGYFANVPASPKTSPSKQLQTQENVALKQNNFQTPEPLANLSLSPKTPKHDLFVEESRSVPNSSSSPTSSLLKHDIIQKTQVPEHDNTQTSVSIANPLSSPTASSLKHDIVQEPKSIANFSAFSTQVLEDGIAQESESTENVPFSPKFSPSEHGVAQNPESIENVSPSPQNLSSEYDAAQKPEYVEDVPFSPKILSLEHGVADKPESTEKVSFPLKTSSEHDITQEPGLVANSSFPPKIPFLEQPHVQERAILNDETIQEPESSADVSFSEHDVTQDPKSITDALLISQPPFLEQHDRQEKATFEHDTVQEPGSIAYVSLTPKTSSPRQSSIDENTVVENEQSLYQAVSDSPNTPLSRQSPINKDVALTDGQSVSQASLLSPENPLLHQFPRGAEAALKAEQSVPHTDSLLPETPPSHQFPISADAASKDVQSMAQAASFSPKPLRSNQFSISEDVALENEQPAPQPISSSPTTPLPSAPKAVSSSPTISTPSAVQALLFSPKTLPHQSLDEDIASEDEQPALQAVSISPKTLLHESPKDEGVTLEDNQLTPQAIQSESTQVPSSKPRSPSPRLQFDTFSDSSYPAVDTGIATRSNFQSIENHAVEGALGTGLLGSSSTVQGKSSKKDKKKDKNKDKKAAKKAAKKTAKKGTKGSKSTDFEDHEESNSVDTAQLDESDVGDKLSASGPPNSVDTWQPSQDTPLFTKKDIDTNEADEQNGAFILEKPSNRDSAIHVYDSPVITETPPIHHTIRDSGYQDAELSPRLNLDKDSMEKTGEQPNENMIDRLARDAEPARNIDDQNDKSLHNSKYSSGNPLNISVEVDLNYEISISSPGFKRERSISPSKGMKNKQEVGLTSRNQSFENLQTAGLILESARESSPAKSVKAIGNEQEMDSIGTDKSSESLQTVDPIFENAHEPSSADSVKVISDEQKSALFSRNQNSENVQTTSPVFESTRGPSPAESVKAVGDEQEMDLFGTDKNSENLQTAGPIFDSVHEPSSADLVKVIGNKERTGFFNRNQDSENLQTAGPDFESARESSPTKSAQAINDKQDMDLFGGNKSSEKLRTAGPIFETAREPSPAKLFKSTADNQETSLSGRNQSSETLETAGPENRRESSPANSSKATSDDQELGLFGKNRSSENLQTAGPIFDNSRGAPSVNSLNSRGDKQGEVYSGRNQSSENLQALAPILEDPRQPSPVSSTTTKDRSSTPLLSSPSTREDFPHRSSQHDGPFNGRVDWESLDEDDREDWSQFIESPKNNGQVPAAKRALSPVLSDKSSDKERPSIFGGPVGMTEHNRTPSRSPFASDHSNRQKLNTITEYSPEESPLHKKNRSLSDVGSPERGVKSRRRTATPQRGSQLRINSPLGAKAANKNPISIDDLATRLSWPPVDEDNHTVDLERSRSGNTNDPTDRQETWSALAGGPLKQHESERRSLSGASASASARSVGSVESINAIIRTPDQIIRSASGLSQRGSGTPPLRRSDRSVSGDLRVAHGKSEAKNVAKAYVAQAEPDISIPSSSTYDPIKDKGKTRVRDMADVYVSCESFLIVIISHLANHQSSNNSVGRLGRCASGITAVAYAPAKHATEAKFASAGSRIKS